MKRIPIYMSEKDILLFERFLLAYPNPIQLNNDEQKTAHRMIELLDEELTRSFDRGIDHTNEEES